MSAEVNILRSHGWHRHESKSLRIPIVDENGDPVVMTAQTMRWMLLRNAGDATALLSKSTGAGSITVINDAVDNIVAIAIDDGDYTTLTAGHYYHELRDDTSDVVLAYGTVELLPGMVTA